MTNYHETTQAMESARDINVFEQTVNTLEPKGERLRMVVSNIFRTFNSGLNSVPFFKLHALC